MGVGIKPGEKATVGGTSYKAIKPHKILSVDVRGKYLVEYPEKEALKREWVSIRDLEELGVIEIASFEANREGL